MLAWKPEPRTAPAVRMPSRTVLRCSSAFARMRCRRMSMFWRSTRAFPCSSASSLAIWEWSSRGCAAATVGYSIAPCCKSLELQLANLVLVAQICLVIDGTASLRLLPRHTLLLLVKLLLLHSGLYTRTQQSQQDYYLKLHKNWISHLHEKLVLVSFPGELVLIVRTDLLLPSVLCEDLSLLVALNANLLHPNLLCLRLNFLTDLNNILNIKWKIKL